MADTKKYLDLAGLTEYHSQLKTKWFDRLDAVVDDSSRIINTTVLSGTPEASGSGATLENTDVVASTKWVYSQIQGITEPMIFKGDVYIVNESDVLKYYNTRTGSEGSYVYSDEITASNAKSGYTYKVITSDDTDVNVGDTLIANVAGTPAVLTWTVVPSGDEPKGTVTGITISGATDAITASAVASDGIVTLTVNDASTTKGVVSVANNSGLAISSGAISVKKGNTITKDTTDGTLGVNIDGATLQADSNGVISARTATSSDAGVVSPDGSIITVDGSGNITVADATSSSKGVVSVPASGGLTVSSGALGVNVDGTIAIIDDNKVTVAKASNSAFGVVKYDGTIIKGGANQGEITVETATNSDTSSSATGKLGVVRGSVDNGITVNNGTLEIATISNSEITNIVTPTA